MRRVFAMVMSALILVIGGCGVKSYELRLEKTLEEMRYQDRLNKLLTPAQTKGKWESLAIYLRVPKNLTPAKSWLLIPIEPGKFDLEASFLEPQKQNLHVLARVKMPKAAKKKPAAEKGAADKAAAPAGAAVPAAERKDFYTDVIDVLVKSYPTVAPEDLAISKFKPDTEKNNDFRRHAFTAEGKNVDAYFYKQDPYEVAFFFEYPKAEHASLTSKIKLCLESFAIGDKARRLFSGSTGEEEPGAEPGAPKAF